MICKENCLFPPRALVGGIPVRINFAPEKNGNLYMLEDGFYTETAPRWIHLTEC